MSNVTRLNNSSAPVAPDNIEFVTGNDGVAVPPDGVTHVWNLLGDNAQGVDVSGVILTNTSTITMFDATEVQKGVVLLASNAETIAGTDTAKAVTPDDLTAKLGAQTLHGIPYGNSTTGAIQWLAEAADGQIPIGDSGGVPILGNITSLDGSVDIDNGPGAIDLSIPNQLTGTVQTIGAVTGDLITFTTPDVAGTYKITSNFVVFDTTVPLAPLGASYEITGTVIADGAGALSTVGTPSIAVDGDPSYTSAQADVSILGLDIIVQVTGLGGATARWTGNLTYIFGGA